MNRKLWTLLALLAVVLAAPALLGPARLAGPFAIPVTRAQSTPPAKPSTRIDPATIASSRIETEELDLRITAKNGGVLSAALKSPRYRTKGEPTNLVSTDKPEYLPFAVELNGKDLGETPFEHEQLGPRSVVLHKQVDGLRVSRKLEAGKGPYQLWLTTRIENLTSEPKKASLAIATHHYVPRESEGTQIFFLPAQSPQISSGLCRHSGELEREYRDALVPGLSFGPSVELAGIENVYFVMAIAPEVPAESERCELTASDRGRDASGEPVGTLLSARVVWKPLVLEPGSARVLRALAYVGPKSPDELAAAGHGLKDTIQSGWFTGIAEGLTWLLREIHEVVGNWGIAIILLTLLVKTLLFPLTIKQMTSMARMKELKPELDRVNQLYADDREKKGAAIMELYRTKGINPMAGCFPVLLQLPIWFSLYASLSSNVELLHAPFALWVDLSSPDPYFALPLALGALMFLQQKMAPAVSADPLQQKMMLYMMPVMMTSFMLFLPAGLCLYMFTNSALSILQQRWIEARLARVSAKPNAPAENASTPNQPGEAKDVTSIADKRPKIYRPSKAERRSRRGKR